jgi:catechol 2,3-dioxygenase-like lactoylglutathione lyase family enzyme
MLDHVSIVVADWHHGMRFYDAVMAALDVPCVWRDEAAAGYGVRNAPDDDSHTYLTVRQSDGAMPATLAAAGRHWCFRAPNRAAVDAFHAAGLAGGGTCNGRPGLRPHYHAAYYAAFLRDPDGNVIEAVCHREQQAGQCILSDT